MKSLVVGKGNLGLDIAQKFGSDTCSMHETDQINVEQYDIVFWCVGGFSVEGALDRPITASMVLCSAPLNFTRRLRKDAAFIVFSSDYAVYPQTYYGALKMVLEKIIPSAHQKTDVIRVMNLYGNHHPLRGFQGKILARSVTENPVHTMSWNHICPTPTWWIAHLLHELAPRLGSIGTCNIVPYEEISGHLFAQEILGRPLEAVFDHQRPLMKNIQPAEFIPETSWRYLWELSEPNHRASIFSEISRQQAAAHPSTLAPSNP